MLFSSRSSGQPLSYCKPGPATAYRGSASSTCLSWNGPGRSVCVRVLNRQTTVSEDGSRAKRIKVSGQQVPTAAQFSAPVQEVQQMLDTLAQPASAKSTSAKRSHKTSSTSLLDDMATTAQAAAEVATIRQEALEQQEMMGQYQELLAGIAADYKDMLERQVATKKAAEQQAYMQLLEMQTTNSSMSQELQTLRDQSDQQQAQITTMQHEKQGYKQQLRVVVAEVQDLKQQLLEARQAAEQQSAPPQAEAAVTAEELAAAKQQVAELQAQVAAMMQQLASAQAEKESLGQQLNEVMAAADEAAEEAATKAAADAMSKLELQSRVTTLESELAASKQLQQCMMDENRALQEDLRHANSTAQDLLSSNRALMGQVRDLKQQHKQQYAQVAALQEEKAAMSAELRGVAMELHHLQTVEHKLQHRNQQLTDLVATQQSWKSSHGSVTGAGVAATPDPWINTHTNSSNDRSVRAGRFASVYRGYQAFAAPKVCESATSAGVKALKVSTGSNRHTALRVVQKARPAAGVSPAGASDRDAGRDVSGDGDELLYGAMLCLSVVVPLVCQYTGIW